MVTQDAFRIRRPARALVYVASLLSFSGPGHAADGAVQDPTLARGRYLAETVALGAQCHSAPTESIDGRPPLVANYAGIDCPVCVI
jgi:hypothetical protein